MAIFSKARVLTSRKYASKPDINTPNLLDKLNFFLVFLPPKEAFVPYFSETGARTIR